MLTVTNAENLSKVSHFWQIFERKSNFQTDPEMSRPSSLLLAYTVDCL